MAQIKMKASILIVATDGYDALRNSLYSLSLQRTSFPYEVCVLDVNSTIELEPLVRKYIPNAKYRKINDSKVVFMYSQGICLDLADPLSDVIVIQGNDIIYTQSNNLENLCNGVKPKLVSMAEVLNMDIDADLYKNFNSEIGKILNNWEIYARRTPPTGDIKPKEKKYSGPGSNAILFFLGAITRKDLEEAQFRKNNCDAVLYPNLARLGVGMCHPGVKGVHQKHFKIIYPCPIVDECKYNCSRKKGE